MEKQILISMCVEEFQAIIHQVVADVHKEFKTVEQPVQEDRFLLLSRNETAEFLKVTLVTLSDWSKRGLIKAHYLGGRVYYVKGELIRALAK